MADNDLIKWMREIIDQGETSEEMGIEITMWRERFLESLPKHEDKKHAATIWRTFLHIPSKNMNKKPPEVIIKEIEGYTKT
jgi:hypothetical protein